VGEQAELAAAGDDVPDRLQRADFVIGPLAVDEGGELAELRLGPFDGVIEGL